MKQTIGVVARALGLNPKTIRYYEEIGLVPEPRREGGGWASPGRRIYADDEIERLRFIKQARQLDFGLDDIRGLLARYEQGPACGCSARPMLARLLEQKVKEVDGHMRDLAALRNQLLKLQVRTQQLEGREPADVRRQVGETPSGALLDGDAEHRRKEG